MSFVSMNEVLNSKLSTRGGGTRTGYTMLAISRSDLGEKSLNKNKSSYKTKLAFYLTATLVARAQLTQGIKLDFQFDFKNKEGALVPTTKGGRTLCAPKADKSKVHCIYFPYFPGFGFPLPKESSAVAIPEGNIHINKKGIVFSLRNVEGFTYEVTPTE